MVTELVEPDAQGAKPFPVDSIDSAGALGMVGHQHRLLEDLQMLRDGGTGHGHAPGDLAHGSRSVPKRFQDRAPSRILQGDKDVRRVRHQ